MIIAIIIKDILMINHLHSKKSSIPYIATFHETCDDMTQLSHNETYLDHKHNSLSKPVSKSLSVTRPVTETHLDKNFISVSVYLD